MNFAWQGNWKKRIFERVQDCGFATLSDYLSHFPGLSYLEVANLLGKEDVAAFHVEWLHFEEAIQQQNFRAAAMDSLIRQICHHLKNGWKENVDFDTASIWADWIVLLENYALNIRPVAIAVWNELLNSNLPLGWKPNSNDDNYITLAFERAWPNTEIIIFKDSNYNHLQKDKLNQ